MNTCREVPQEIVWQMLIRNGAVAVCLLQLLLSSAMAIELPEDFVDEAYIAGLDGQITGFDATVPGRVFISEKAGIVRVVRDGQLLSEPFLDISEIVNDRVDRGMLSVAVHPQFPATPFVYLLYTYDPPELVINAHTGPGVLDGNGNRVSRLVRYTADAANDFNVAIADSAEVILGRNSTYQAIGEPEGIYDTSIPSCGPISSPAEDCLPVDEDSHTIGAMRFAEDGSLYVSNGDGASYQDFAPLTQMALNPDSLRGKILRIDPDTGKGLSDNPFYDGDPDSNRARVISTGLRNPYSMTIHPLTGEPYVGDVGEKQWEEINGGSSLNFGWPCYEGGEGDNIRQPGFEPLDFCQALYQSSEDIEAPLLSWEHQTTGSSALVGDFYFGEVFPANYSGMLFYGDFIQGWMRYADVSDPTNVTSFEFATDMPPMTEIRVGDDGALYYASITTGEIRRIRYVGENGATDGQTSDPGTDTGSTIGDSIDSGSSDDARVKVGAVSPWWLVWLISGLCASRLERYRASDADDMKHRFVVRWLALCALASVMSACSEGVRLETDRSANGPGGSGGETGEDIASGELPTLSPHASGFKGSYFSGSGQCSTCHDGLSDDAGNDISIASDWSSSMMANAARDPYWIAKVASEMDRHPSLQASLADTCTRCHAPIANETARKDGTALSLFDGGFLDVTNPLFDHAMEGVSCTLCHQVEDDGLLGSVEGVSGNFSIREYQNASDRPAYGPYSDPNGVYMRTQTQFNPVYGPHIGTSESCAACHDLRTTTAHSSTSDSAGANGNSFPEQMVFTEWRNSAFATDGSSPQTCQSCHMPEVSGSVMLASDGGGVPREGFSKHSFLGANTVMQTMLMNYSAELGISVEPQQFEQSIIRNRIFLKGSASVQILESVLNGQELVSRVRIQNLAGHKLPSGFPSRRAFIHFVVKDSADVAVFESGALNTDGSVVGVAADAASKQYESHYQTIDSSDQVQVYEAIMSDEAAGVTHSLLQARGYLKDNRLLPAGLDKVSAPDEIRTVGLAEADADFDAGGDEIVYRIQVPVSDSYTVYAELVYQPLAFGHIQDLFDSANLPAVGQFKTMFDATELKAEIIASDSQAVRLQ